MDGEPHPCMGGEPVVSVVLPEAQVGEEALILE